MKNTTKVTLSIFTIAVATIFTTEYSSVADGHAAGAPAGVTGSPGDGATCAKVGCHTGAAVTPASGWITTNIPAAGYTPGSIYTITATATRAGHTEFGFEVSPQNSAGTFLGTLTNTSTETKLVGTGNNYVTQTSTGTTGTTGFHTWTFDWTAPSAGTGNVTFYGAFNATNSSNNALGDSIFTSTLLVKEATACTAPTITSTTPGSRCDAGTVTLGATASAGTINWYAASTGGSSLGTGTSFTTPSISATTTYYVDATNGGCTTASRTAVVATVNTTPTITGSTPGSRCGTGTVTLGASSSGGTINWYAASTGGSSLGTETSFTTPSISANTDYYVDATSGSCTTSSRTMVTATVNIAPTITGSTPASRCDAGTVTLGATASAGTISWYAASTGGSSLGTGTSFTTPSISTTTTYYVDANDGTCTSTSRTSVVATISGGPSITGTTPGSRCDAGTVNIGATASAGTINWYDAPTGGSSLGTGTSFTTPSISTSTPYYVDADDGTCVTSTRTSVLATVNPLPTATISGDATVCTGSSSTISIALTGTSPWSFSYGSATGSNPVSGITSSTYTTSVSAGTYTVASVTDGNSCAGTSSGSATITENSPIVVSNLVSSCSGGNYTVDFDLSGGDAASYVVTGDAGTLTGSHFTSNSIASGVSYSFTPNDKYNCTSTAQTGTKNCNCAASADISGGGTICNGAATTITVTLGGAQPWDFTYAIDGVSQAAITGLTTSPYTFTTSTTGAYTLVSVNDVNCIGSTSGNVSVSQTLPTATLSGGGAVCNDGSTTNLNITLTGTSPWNYTLSDGTNSTPLTSNIASFSLAKSTAGTYTITSISDASCEGTSSGSATITVNNLPTVGSTVSPSATVCAGTSVTLSGTGASTYVWTGGTVSVTDGQAFVPVATVTYTVTGTDANNCSAKATTTVNVNNLPTVTTTVSPSSAAVCAGGSVTLSGNGATSYVWSGGSGSVTDGQSFVPTGTATYTVIGTDANNCSNTTTRVVTVNNLPTITATASPSSSVCSGSSVTLSGNGASTYTWFGGSGNVVNGQSFTPVGSETFTVIGTDANSCSNTATQLVTVSTCTTVTTPPTPTISRPSPGNLLVSSATAGNQWYLDGVLIPGATYQTLPLSQTTPSGDYTVVVTINGVSSLPSAPTNIVNTSVTEINNNSFFTIYPNPSDGNLNVSFDVSERATYKIDIRNMLGQFIYQETLSNYSGAYSTQINIADFGQGVYMISLTSPTTETIKKIIVY